MWSVQQQQGDRQQHQGQADLLGGSSWREESCTCTVRISCCTPLCVVPASWQQCT